MALETLSQLDQLIWQQYEKVTHAAEKYVGWDKYNLMNLCTKATAIGGLGASIYAGILAQKENFSNFGALSLSFF